MAATPTSSGGSLAEHGERHGKPPEVLGKAAATAPTLDRRVEARPIPGRAGAEAEPAAESERPLARRLSVDAERELDVMITDAERDHPGVESQQLPLEAASHFPGVRDLAEGRSVAGGAPPRPAARRRRQEPGRQVRAEPRSDLERHIDLEVFRRRGLALRLQRTGPCNAAGQAQQRRDVPANARARERS